MVENKAGTNVLIMGGGVAGQRLGANKWFDPEVVGADTAQHMRGHIMDPNLPLRKFDDLHHMHAAARKGRLTIDRHIPSDRTFDVAYIASPTGMHVNSLIQAKGLLSIVPLHQPPPEWIILEKPAASGEQEESQLRMLLDWNWLDENRIYVHEPYLLSRGMQRLRKVIAGQRRRGNPPTDINVWSTKDRTPDVARGRTGNEPELGAFGIEFPHTHAAASLLAGIDLGSQHVNSGRNVYYTNVDNNSRSEGTYTEFTHRDTVVRVAQGLGPFIMTNRGTLLAEPRPEITRAAEVIFTDGTRAHLDLRPAVDRHALTKEHPYRHTVLTTYDAAGDQSAQQHIPDYPIKTLITNVLDKLRNPNAPSLPGIGIVPSLARCIAIRELRQEARIEDGAIPQAQS